MSKLTHSTDEGMRQVDERVAREAGATRSPEQRAPMVLKTLVAMARAAHKDDPRSDGALYGTLADEIERLGAAIYFWAMARYPETVPPIADISARGRLHAALDHAEATLYGIYAQSREAAISDYMRDGIDSDTAEIMVAIDERHSTKGAAPIAEWRRVYQGGHHDVWCNGTLHRKTFGGLCHPDNDEMPRDGMGNEFKCNCAYYGKEP